MIVLNGKSLADSLLETQCIHLNDKLRRPKLVVITVGDDDASKVYLRNKRIACEKCDIKFEHKSFEPTTKIETVIEYIKQLNKDNTVDGIIVQQPVPQLFKGIEQYVDVNKDVDGFTTYNLGGTLNNKAKLYACTPQGIMDLLHYYNIDLQGKHVVVIGRSEIVGKPLIGLLLQQNATVTSCNSYTHNLQGITLTANVIISAMGQPKLINSTYITPKCTCIIDVGMNRDGDNKLCGDVDYESIIHLWRCWEDMDPKTERYITPVPGGVGPMTVVSLIKNINMAYCKNIINYRGEI